DFRPDRRTGGEICGHEIGAGKGLRRPDMELGARRGENKGHGSVPLVLRLFPAGMAACAERLEIGAVEPPMRGLGNGHDVIDQARLGATAFAERIIAQPLRTGAVPLAIIPTRLPAGPLGVMLGLPCPRSCSRHGALLARRVSL